METENKNSELVEKASDKPEVEQQDTIIKDITTLKKLRVRVDGLIQICRTAGNESFEKINAVSHLILVKGWMGDVLVYLGDTPLNDNVNIHTFHDIEDETDVSEGLKVQVRKVDANGRETLNDANQIESINHVRRDLSYVETQVGTIDNVTSNAYENFIYQHLREAKFWLDREMFRIKAEAKQKIFSQTKQGRRTLPNRPQKQKPIVSNLGRVGVPRSQQDNPTMTVQRGEPGEGIAAKVERQVKATEDAKQEDKTNN